MILSSVLTQLTAEAEAGRAAISDWRCQKLDELAIKLVRCQESEADAALVAALVRGAGADSLLSENALQSVLQQALQVLEPIWRNLSEQGLHLCHRDAASLACLCRITLISGPALVPEDSVLNTGAATAGRQGSSNDIVYILRILEFCLYAPALNAVFSIQAEIRRMLCSVFALSWAPATLPNGALAGDEEMAESSSQTQVHNQALTHLNWYCFDDVVLIRSFGTYHINLFRILAGRTCVGIWTATRRALVAANMWLRSY